MSRTLASRLATWGASVGRRVLLAALALVVPLVLAGVVLPRGAAAASSGTAVPTGTAPPAPVPEHVTLKLSGPGGRPLFAPVGRPAVMLYGRVTPYVAGQRTAVAFFLRGHQVGTKVLPVAPRSGGSGSFQVRFPTSYAGTITAVVGVHVGPGDVVSAHTPAIQFVHTDISPGSSGASVRLLQSELNGLHYAVPLNGEFEEATERALIAFRKMTGMERVGEAGAEVFRKLSHGEGAFPVRYPHDGRHVEANLTKQVLAEIEPGGKVREIYTMSSGKPSTPTVVGRFQVYEKTWGVNTEGMVDSNYFIRGYAIHGYAEVPTYAASHGCLRVPIPDAAAIYGWVQLGTPVDVYDQGGGGSTTPRGNAGP